MRRIYILLFCIMSASMSCLAQEATSKEFNQIKRSGEYFYYDVTMDNEDNAKTMARTNLAKLINDYYAENCITSSEVTADNLQDVNYLKRNTYGMVRILAYVKKSSYIKNEVTTAPVKKEKTEETTVTSAETAPEINIPIRNVPSPEAAALSKDSVSSALTKWQQDAIADLCKITTADKLAQKLIDLQNKYKVKRFGVQDDCKDMANSFFVVYDSQKVVVALLGPGTDSRYDFLSGGKGNLNSYLTKGMKAIWFQLSK